MTHDPEIIRHLKTCLKDLYERQLEIIGTGIVDQCRQLRILLLKKELRFEIWDDETFDQLQTIIDSSPKHPIETIWFKFTNGLCTIRPLSKCSYLIVVFERDLKLGLPIPYDRYKYDLIQLLSQLDEDS